MRYLFRYRQHCSKPSVAWGAQPALALRSLQTARFRIHAFSFTDDQAMTESCTCKLLAAMPHAPSGLKVIAPSDVGIKSIGHVGAFRAEAREALWPLIESHLHAAA